MATWIDEFFFLVRNKRALIEEHRRRKIEREETLAWMEEVFEGQQEMMNK